MSSLRSWNLEYGQDGFGRNILESIEACSDASRTVCYAPTRFDWLKHENTISTSGWQTGQLFSRDFRGMSLADVNGDGKNDLLLIEGKQSYALKIAFARSDGIFELGEGSWPVPKNDESKAPVTLRTIDINADGYHDVLYPRENGSAVSWVARLSTIDGFGPERVVA
jgi:hypothetical protein